MKFLLQKKIYACGMTNLKRKDRFSELKKYRSSGTETWETT
jgi:hypothetical protein